MREKIRNIFWQLKLNTGAYTFEYFLIQGDSLKPHDGMKFTTKDQDNDTFGKNCAVLFKGAWWFHYCIDSNLNGPYHKSSVKSATSVVWYKFGKFWVSLRKTKMMIRSKAWCLNLDWNKIKSCIKFGSFLFQSCN